MKKNDISTSKMLEALKTVPGTGTGTPLICQKGQNTINDENEHAD
jgi:hypothetical protein